MILRYQHRVAFVTLCFLLAKNVSSQEYQDYNWIFNLRNYKDTTFTSTFISSVNCNFDSSTLHINYEEGNFKIYQNNGSVSDNNGKLLFYTNGCQVLQADHNLMQNGDSINFGKYYVEWWDNCSFGYNGWQDIIILNDANNPRGYYILHKTLNFRTDPIKFFVDALKYTYVDMSLNIGKGSVTKKNQIIYDADDLVWSYLASIHHHNGKDWWLIQMRENSNAYLKFLVNEAGPMLVDSQNIGPKTTRNTSAAGFAKFSPDGKKWAWFTTENGLNIFDFNRETGTLSNQLILKIQHRRDFAGIEFSPNGRFIYVSIIDSLWQVDTWKENLEEGCILIDTFDGFQDPFPTTIQGMNLAPDCKIYVNSSNGVGSMHVINYPNKKGKGCQFIQHGIDLPYFISLGTPNFPRLRVDEVDVCDSIELYTEVIDVDHKKTRLKIYPNPVMDIAKMESDAQGQVYVYDMSGSFIKKQNIHEGENYLDMEACVAGMYFIRFVDISGNEYGGKIVKVRNE
ncbi:MAG: T9SS type A sorting domain-containing protein [Saprospiraceae bacterium]|nr:T9SS type A sorting domain-containing protein [Saprospiraceae bacterium]